MIELRTPLPIHRRVAKDECFVVLRGKVRVTTHNDDGAKNETIIWDRLKELQADSALIDMLRDCFNRVSGGNLHVDQESRENTI